MTAFGRHHAGTNPEPLSPASPLSGIGVVEIGHSVAVPYAGQILADLGATVIKIENPNGGDDARQWVPPTWHDSSAVFQTMNRNKHSACIDLKDPEGRRKVRELAAQSDIVIQNMRPGLIEHCELDAKTLRALDPRLIYCNLGAFGWPGPLSENTGYDPLIQAFSGIMSITGEAGRPPIRVGPSIIDMGSGLWCVIGILAALLQRGQTGLGTTVDTSLFETALAWMNIPLASNMASGCEGTKSGSETPMLAPCRAYQASDRFIFIATENDRLFLRLCMALHRPEWSVDPRFVSNSLRVANRVELNALLDAVIVTQTEHHWTARLSAAGVPCTPVQTTTEVIAHPQTQALGMLQFVGSRSLRLVVNPLRFDGIRPQIRARAPALGADTERALALIMDRPAWRDPKI